jgi:hypothetical protein
LPELLSTSADTQVEVELLSAVVRMDMKPLQRYMEHTVGT